MDCENYGYGLDRRKIKKYLPYNRKLMEQHRSSYYFWLDLYSYKILRDEGYHWPVRLMEPRWEMEKALLWWQCYFSYTWQGAKQI